MKTTSLDVLEKAELPPAQSHAILKVMELEMAAAYDRLATKDDLKNEVLGLRNEITSATAGLKAELKGDIMALRAETHSIEGKLARWVLTCILAQTAALTGVGYFLLAHFRK